MSFTEPDKGKFEHFVFSTGYKQAKQLQQKPQTWNGVTKVDLGTTSKPENLRLFSTSVPFAVTMHILLVIAYHNLT